MKEDVVLGTEVDKKCVMRLAKISSLAMSMNNLSGLRCKNSEPFNGWIVVKATLFVCTACIKYRKKIIQVYDNK